MNGMQIENVLKLIDCNLALTRDEATKYIQSHREEVAQSLANNGVATIPTSAGDIQLTIDDLRAVAA
jgi:hypothetical protein